jgi:hypothetical protein
MKFIHCAFYCPPPFIPLLLTMQGEKCPPLQVGEGIVSAIAVLALALALEVDGEEGTNGIEVCIITTRININSGGVRRCPF